MNHTPSSDRPTQPSGDGNASEGSSISPSKPTGEGIVPSAEDQPTVISDRPPINAPSQAEDAAALSAGHRLGHFELMEYVGGGGMGRVFRARDLQLGRIVALKILSSEQARDESTVLRFRNEARAAARLNHDGIAQVYFVGEDHGLPFIAFEFVEGMDVRTLVERKGVLSLIEAVSYTLQAAEALKHAAEHDVIHRDIKPSNVLITREGRAKLIDMGLARMQTGRGSADDLTASGVTLGTFDYISPEQARDPRHADTRSDIYSLGCTLFFMLAGRPPFPRGTVLQKLLQHQGDEPPDVRQFRPDLPEEVSRVLRKMMAKDPRRRFEDPDKLINALLVLAKQIGLRPAGLGQTVWVAPEPPKVSFLKHHLPWTAPVAALILIVVLLDQLWDSPVGNIDELQPLIAGRQKEPADDRGADPPAEPEAEDAMSPPADRSPDGTAESDVSPEEPFAPPSTEQPVVPSDNVLAPSYAPAPINTAEVASPNPLDGLLEDFSKGNGVAPEVALGEMSAAEPVSWGLSVDAQTPSSEGLLTGAVGTSPEPVEIDPMAPFAPPMSRILAVDGIGVDMGTFSTLSAAFGAAADGDVIELCYDGRQDEEPLTPANLRVTIRGGDGYQPVLVFRPAEIDMKHPGSMVTLIGSRLTLTGVAVELDIPRDVPADSWSLFEIGQGGQVRLQQCSLTIRNALDQQAYHRDVAFFRLKAAPGRDIARSDLSATTVAPVLIELEDSLVRGEAVFLKEEDPQPVDLTWKNGLLVTTERLLVAEGSEQSPRPNEAVRINLENLTAVVRNGLCRLDDDQFTPYQLPVTIQCIASILKATAGSTLMEQSGVSDMVQSRQRFEWNGVENVYDGFADFQRIRHYDPDVLPEIITFDAWQLYWEVRTENPPSVDRIEWDGLPGVDRPVHTHTPADYTWIDPTTGVVGNIGCQTDHLPRLPPEPVVEEPSYDDFDSEWW